MNVTHWVPNHFEPALPNAPQLETDIFDVNADQNTLEEKPDTPEMKTKKMKPSTPEIKLDIPGMKMDTTDKKPGLFAMNPGGKMDTSTPEMNPGAPEIVADISAELDELTLKTSVPKEAQNKPGRFAYCIAPDVPPPEQCSGQWVIVKYDRKPYPGYVEDVDAGELYVKCMHTVGKAKNCFFWLKLFNDLLWYEHENILAVIPEPALKNGVPEQYSVDPELSGNVDYCMREQLVFFQYNNLLLKTRNMTVSCVSQLCYWRKHLSLTPMKYVGIHVYIEKMVSMLAFFKVLQKCNLTYCIQLSFPLFLRYSNTTDIANVSRVL